MRPEDEPVTITDLLGVRRSIVAEIITDLI